MRATIRPIAPADDEQIAAIIRQVLAEFDATGWGTSDGDAEVDDLSAYYDQPGAAYYIGEIDGAMVGGGGYAPLAGAGPEVVEIQKMYLLPASRGRGIGRMILTRAMAEIRALPYRTVYLESMGTMHAAHALYASFGFRPIDGPMGATGHTICDRFFALSLSNPEET